MSKRETIDIPDEHDCTKCNGTGGERPRRVAKDGYSILEFGDCESCSGYGMLEVRRLPARFDVCHRCEGRGSHTNPSIDGNGITGSEMEELGYEFMEDYMSGVYDVQCYECNGKRVVLVVDWDACTKEEQEAYDTNLRIESELRAEEEAERRFGC